MNEIKEKFNNVIDSGGINEIYIGPEEEAPEEAKIIIDSNQMKTQTNIEQMIDNKLSTETQQDVTTDSDAVKCGYKVDGKDVYVKRVNIGALPNATHKDVSSGLSNITINKLEGVGIRTTDNLTIAIPYSAVNFLVAAMYVSSTNVVRITSQADMSAYIGYMNVYFTYNEEV